VDSRERPSPPGGVPGRHGGQRGTPASGKPLGIVCPVPAGLLATLDENGRTPFAGYRVRDLPTASSGPVAAETLTAL